MHTLKKYIYENNFIRPQIVHTDSYLGSGIYDRNDVEIFEGDILQIDFDAAQKIIGEGYLITDLKNFTLPNSRLQVEFVAARFHLVWRTHNGSADTGIDVSFLNTIKDCVTVIGHAEA